MITLRPASVLDCRAFPVVQSVFPTWEASWAGDAGYVARTAFRPWIVEEGNLPLAILGTGVLPRDGTHWPWVWAVLRPAFPGCERLLRGSRRLIRDWLDEHALGCYTVPQIEAIEYTRFLAMYGFRRRDDVSRGFWQWRSSLR